MALCSLDRNCYACLGRWLLPTLTRRVNWCSLLSGEPNAVTCWNVWWRTNPCTLRVTRDAIVTLRIGIRAWEYLLERLAACTAPVVQMEFIVMIKKILCVWESEVVGAFGGLLYLWWSFGFHKMRISYSDRTAQDEVRLASLMAQQSICGPKASKYRSFTITLGHLTLVGTPLEGR
jgi:hypothetical protein